MTARIDNESLAAHVDHFGRRVLIDAMLDGWAATWERAARRWEAAKPRPGEHHGAATPEELRAAWRRCDEIARACRARAKVAPLHLEAEVDNVLEETAC